MIIVQVSHKLRMATGLCQRSYNKDKGESRGSINACGPRWHKILVFKTRLLKKRNNSGISSLEKCIGGNIETSPSEIRLGLDQRGNYLRGQECDPAGDGFLRSVFTVFLLCFQSISSLFSLSSYWSEHYSTLPKIHKDVFISPSLFAAISNNALTVVARFDICLSS